MTAVDREVVKELELYSNRFSSYPGNQPASTTMKYPLLLQVSVRKISNVMIIKPWSVFATVIRCVNMCMTSRNKTRVKYSQVPFNDAIVVDMLLLHLDSLA